MIRGVPIEPLEPGSGEWLKTMSASKIAAVVGKSPHDSRLSLYYKMTGDIIQEDLPWFSRGHFLEPAIMAWFAAQHPDFDVTKGVAYAHPSYPHFTAAPDGDVCRPEGPAILECKSASNTDEWDPIEGTVPAGYHAQVQWQMACAGVDTCYVAMIGPYLEFAEYVITADPAYQQWLFDEAQAFMDTLPWGANPRRPDIDGDLATYEAVRKLHPNIDRDATVRVPADLVDVYTATKAELELLTKSHLRAKSALLDAMGNARIARANGVDVLRRQPGKGGSVSLHPIKQRNAA